MDNRRRSVNSNKQIKFTTVPECEERIARMNSLIKEFKECSSIQFPIVDNEEKQFQHYSLHHISNELHCLELQVKELEQELERYKKVIKCK